ncbi:helix-turn-helix transcriptional regulator [Amycolatopsis sp. Hca4]|uniref:helix-turn-helix transcriptional regulator n=1 Tax=Amycolatopsis sp. Hca4 TaxID=2742131 RepID=UPI0020CAD420|nr:AraC family transcriptional regulator [Amycolatopsis sp. Hca4]
MIGTTVPRRACSHASATADVGRAGGIRRRGVAAVLAGQEAVLQRASRHQRQALVQRERGQLTLDRPRQQRILDRLWRLLTGPHRGLVRRIGLADSGTAHVGRAIRRLRDDYAEPIRVEELARLSGLSVSAFHRHFRPATAMSPLQFQKRIRLQAARSLLLAGAGDVAGVGHLVGYDSPSQFNREYRRLFGAPPGQDAARLREAASAGPQLP